jgi:DNA topoisomerase-3
MTLIQKQIVDPAWGNFARSWVGCEFHLIKRSWEIPRLHEGEFSKPRNGKKNDQAHPPIHPTAHAGNLSNDEKRVYEFVARRFLACCSKDALGFQTTVDVVCGGEEFYATGKSKDAHKFSAVFTFILQDSLYWKGTIWKCIRMISGVRMNFRTFARTKGSRLLRANFSRVKLHDQRYWPRQILSIWWTRTGSVSEPIYSLPFDSRKHSSGTDATIAQHIQTIIDRGYVIERMDGSTKHLVPSTLGIGLVEGYNDIDFERSLSKPQLRRQVKCGISVFKQSWLTT